MTHIYSVRHAEPNYENHDDSLRELTPKGLEDRKLVTDFLSREGVDYVLSSPYKRAIDTVAHFAENYGHGIEPVEDFRERRVDSCWIEDFQGFTRKQWEDFDYKLSDGETLREVQERNIRALKGVLEKYQGKTVVVGSHGTALSTIVNYYRPYFGFEDFDRIRTLMPWIVHFSFEGEQCIKIESYNVFTKQLEEL